MNTEKKKILDRITKLLCLAADQKGSPEGETAELMAQKLMETHKIDKAEIGTGAGDEFGSKWMKCYVDQEGAKRWPVFLGQAIADFLDTRLAFSQSPFAVCFVGMTGDVESCRFLFHKLMFYMETKSFNDYQEKSDYVKRQQYGQAGSIRISERLQEIKKAMDEATVEVPIPPEHQPKGSTKYSITVSGKFLAERKLEMIEKAMDEFFDENETVEDNNLKPQEPIDREAWLKGHIAGSNAPINTELDNVENAKLN